LQKDKYQQKASGTILTLRSCFSGIRETGTGSCPKNKDGLLLRYQEAHTHVVDDTSTYPHEDVEAAVALAAAATTVATTHSRPCLSTTTARYTLPGPTRSGTARSSTTQSSALALKRFALADAGDPAVSHAARATTTLGTNTNVKANATTTDTTAMASPAAVGRNPKQIPAPAPQLDWCIDDAPFDVGIHLDLDAPARPLCNVDCDDDDDSSSDDDSIFVDLSRD
jgi:hypothetical protein